MSLLSRYEDTLVDLTSELLATGEAKLQLAPALGELTFHLSFVSEMDELTHQLETAGLRIWFSCEVDGAEYRLAAPGGVSA